MKLKKVIIENFRSYNGRKEVEFDDLTTFIGKNDIGKSTVLEALEIFFNNSKVKIEPKDSCVHSDSDKVTICCTFENAESVSIVIDSTVPTSPEQEYLLNSQQQLEIHKVFDCSKKSPSVEIFVNAMYPTIEGASDLHELKNTSLKARIRELGIDTTEVDIRSNVELRKAIFDSFENLSLEERMIPVKAEGVKPLWDKLNLHLPIFTLFQSDRQSSDGDSEVQDPMKLAVNAAIQRAETQLEEIKRQVMEEAIEVAENTLVKLREMDDTLANQLSPQFLDEPKWSNIFKLSLEGDDGIPINKRGSGVRRLILLSFFRAEAEKNTLGSDNRSIIYAIEEPETSQHPSNQLLIANTLKSLSENENTQVILTTHVPGLAGVLPTESLRFITTSDEEKIIKKGNDNETLEEIADTLGVLPNVTEKVKVMVIVEGVHDVSTIQRFSQLVSGNVDGIIDLTVDERAVIMPAGGSTLAKWVELNYLKKFNLPEVHIYDSDALNPPKYHRQVSEVNMRHDNSIAFSTQKRELENYLHKDVINSVCGINITFTSVCSVPELAAKALYERDTGLSWGNLDAENQRGKRSRVKGRLNNEVVNSMTYEQLCIADEKKEVQNWLKEISLRCEGETSPIKH